MSTQLRAAPTELANNEFFKDSVLSLLRNAPDPDPTWAARHPDRALAFLFVSPRPCAALDVLIDDCAV